jgi:23S rRNA (adenine2503-C2)-methyltransferase
MSLPRLTELTREGARELAAREGLASYHGDQLFAWVMKRGVLDPSAMTDLPAGFRALLAKEFDPAPSRIVRRESDPRSTTEKVLVRVGPDEAVEAVLIAEGERSTICLSTQVGCPVRCTFCASGLFGLRRNLTRGEILEQYVELAAQAARAGRRITNLVVMGMGEPMMNVRNLLEALAIVTDPAGPGLGARHVTVSTIGVAKGLDAFVRETKPYTLALSLHAPDDELRKRIVPFEPAMSVAAMVRTAREYLATKGREVTFEYVLLEGVNASRAHATALARLLAGVQATVNLIPFNEVPEVPARRPSDRDVDAFAAELRRRRVKTTVRKRKGHDIAAACGQLRLRDLGREPPVSPETPP